MKGLASWFFGTVIGRTAAARPKIKKVHKRTTEQAIAQQAAAQAQVAAAAERNKNK